jgi:hypothetical protein
MAYIGNTNTTQGFIPAVDYFNGDGATVAFTLSRPVASVAQVQAVIENVPQNPGDAYTVSGNTITFTSAPPNGTGNIYVYYTSPITQVIQPGQGTVGSNQVADGVTINFNDGSAASPSITNTGDTNTGMFFPAADTIAFAEGGVESMRIDSSGNVGIGTASPSNKLHVSATSQNDADGLIRAENTTASTVNASLTAKNYYGTSQFMQWENNGLRIGSRITTNGGNGNVIFTAGADTERMRIDSNGNVGISTASPITKLNISGSSGFSGELGTFAITGNTSAKRLAFGVDSTSTMQGWIQSVENGIAARELVLQGLGGAVLFNGSTASSGIAAIQKGGAGGGCILQFFKPNSGATNVILNYFGTSTYVGGMNMDNTSTSFITSSDARLKKDIVESKSASEKIDNIRVVSHGWKHDDAVVDYGLIAQELHEIMPRAVTKGDDGEEVETVWSVDYSKLVPMLIKAHQEQQAIITDLKARIEALEAK